MKRSEKLIQTIRENDIRPAPKAYFLIKRALVWAAFLAAVLLGALAFSVILFCIQQTDFDLISHLQHSRLELALGLLPFFWLISLIVFLMVAMTSFRQSPKGYKLPTGRLVAYCTALSVLAGTVVFLAGGGQWLEHTFDVRVSLYESMQEKKVKIWSMPNEGYLSGTVLEANDSTFILQDFGEKTWTIHYDDAFMPPVVQLEAGEKVKLVGKVRGRNRFDATEIRPWGGPGMRMRRSRQ